MCVWNIFFSPLLLFFYLRKMIFPCAAVQCSIIRNSSRATNQQQQKNWFSSLGPSDSSGKNGKTKQDSPKKQKKKKRKYKFNILACLSVDWQCMCSVHGRVCGWGGWAAMADMSSVCLQIQIRCLPYTCGAAYAAYRVGAIAEPKPPGSVAAAATWLPRRELAKMPISLSKIYYTGENIALGSDD